MQKYSLNACLVLFEPTSFVFSLNLYNTLAKKKVYKLIFVLLFIAIPVVFYSCSTKKNTFTRRVYHNLTSHYNGYFNGKEALKEGEQELAKISIDNYNRILPPVNYGSKENVGGIGTFMDRAIAKASMVIQKHSMYFKNTEHVRWIDDSYLLMAKANFYKQEYKTAIRTFDFIIKRYKNSDIKYDAMLWMAKCYIQTKEYDQAESILDNLQSAVDKNKAGQRLNRDISFTYAEYYIARENYGPAEEFLLKTIKFHHPKGRKSRLHFILGQISQRRGDINRAYQEYQKVINLNPNYELTFNARINQAKCYDASTGKGRDIVKSLQKLLKDEKNKDFQDQIYFALAEISAKDGDSVASVGYLRDAVRTSTKNKYQKGVASLRLGNIFYLVPDYPLSQAYYDTAVQSLPSDYADLQSIKRRAGVLNDLVKNLMIVEREDSLQRIAKMSEKDRLTEINKIIQKLQEDEARKQKEESERSQGMSLLYRNKLNNPGGNQNPGGTGANWYFYNPATISFGFTEFEKKWGKRKLEDNWRLSNKEPVIEFDEETAGEEGDSIASDSIAKRSTDPKDPQTYLQDLPLTEEKLAKSDIKIKEALYNCGNIYYFGLSDVENSTVSYESVIKRFSTDTSYYLKSCYSLYEMHKDEGNTAKADYYKNIILNRFPDSDFAKVILDPSYKKELMARKNKAGTLYQEVYAAYKNGQYATVIQKSRDAGKITNDKSLLARFDYLKAVAIGKTTTKDSLQASLTKWIQIYPKSELKPLVEQILTRLKSNDTLPESSGSTPGSGKVAATLKTYTKNQDAIHLFIIIADIRKINVNALKIKISDHNKKNNSLDNLSTSSLFLDDTRQMITVSNFENQEKAMMYFNALTKSQYVIGNLDEAGWTPFVISVDNYPILYKNKDIETYLGFFEENYH